MKVEGEREITDWTNGDADAFFSIRIQVAKVKKQETEHLTSLLLQMPTLIHSSVSVTTRFMSNGQLECQLRREESKIRATMASTTNATSGLMNTLYCAVRPKSR